MRNHRATLGQPVTPLRGDAPSQFDSYADGAAKSNTCALRNELASRRRLSAVEFQNLISSAAARAPAGR